MHTATIAVEGIFVPNSKGSGHLIDPRKNGRQLPTDPFVAKILAIENDLKKGQWITGVIEDTPEAVTHKNPALIAIKAIDGLAPQERKKCLHFSQLTTLTPEKQLKVECQDGRLANRIIDLFTPIGKGQRGLIVAPPRAGKTTLLKDIAQGIQERYQDILVMVLLVDERPEEVTDFKRELPDAEIYSSSNDEDLKRHLWISDLAIERAKRQVEAGKDVILLMDSLTRLSRAHNAAHKSSGRTMTGGLDIRALEKPRQFFSSARETEEAGSLTIIASALIETGSKMDDLIFQEFKGTGNMELVLNRKCAELRLWPAIDFNTSGTRKEEKILDPDVLKKSLLFRKALAPMKPIEACETLIERMGKTPDNATLLQLITI